MTVSQDASITSEDSAADSAVEREKEPHPTDPQRWADGTLRPGNQNATKHGIYSAARRDGFERLDIPAFYNGLLSDLGDEPSTVQRAYLDNLRDLEITRRMLIGFLSREGIFTKRGRVRSAYDKLLATVVVWDRIAQRIGVERRARHIDPLDALRIAVDEANAVDAQ